MKFVQEKKNAPVVKLSKNAKGKSGLKAGGKKLRLATGRGADAPASKGGFEFLRPPSKQAQALGGNEKPGFFERLAKEANAAKALSVSSSSLSSHNSRGSKKSGSSGSSRYSSGGSSLSSATSLSLSSVDSGRSHDMEIFRGDGDDNSVLSSASSLDAELRAAEEEQEKEILLARMHALKQRGVKLAKNYTAKSSLHELRMEWKRLEYETTTSRSVQRLRRWMLMLVSAAQFACDSSYAPRMIKGKLNGFSDYILSNIDEFDPVFERMADKYGGIAGIGSTGNPFADLGILMLTQLAMFFFVSNSRPGTKAPTAEEIQEKYPNAVRDAATKMAEEMRLKDELFRRQQQQQQQQQDMRAAAAAHDFGHSAFQPVMLYPPSAQSPPPLSPTFLHKAPSEQLLLMSGPPMPGPPMPGPPMPGPPMSGPPMSGPPMSGPPMPMPPMPVFDEEETFPVKGTNQMKVIDMPESAVTRRGRPLKINGPPKRSSSTPPAEKLERTDKPERTEIVVV